MSDAIKQISEILSDFSDENIFHISKYHLENFLKELTEQQEQIDKLNDDNNRFLVLAVKHCPIDHRDFKEIKSLAELNNKG